MTRIMRPGPIRAAAVALGAALLVSGPAVAIAAGTTLWVSPAPTVAGDGTSCADPGFNAIQAAITAAPSGATIKVCQGTYQEQLQITSSVTIKGSGKVVIKLPASPADATTACDTAPGTGGYQPDQDGISICGPISVTLTGITISAAWPTSTCDDSLYGILIAGGATVTMRHSNVAAAGARPLNGCQGGIGIEDGMAWTTPNEAGHLVLSHLTVSGYQKNGITVDGKGSTAQISNVTVRGIGATTQIAQNGIQVSNGAKATVTHSSVRGNECNVAVCGPHGLTQTQSTGLLFYGAARGSSVTDSMISGNDIGVYYAASSSGRAPTLPQVLISGDDLVRNRYEGVVLDQGKANVTHCTIASGDVGIEVLQYNGQTFGSTSIASFDTIKLMSSATVDVLSDRAATGDMPGKFTISRSDINRAPVRDHSVNLPIVRIHDF